MHNAVLCTCHGLASSISVMQEVSVLAKCCSPNITEYFASILMPGTTELLIIMELMATSVSDLVSFDAVTKTVAHNMTSETQCCMDPEA